MCQKSSDFFKPIAFSCPYTLSVLMIITFLITLINISITELNSETSLSNFRY